MASSAPTPAASFAFKPNQKAVHPHQVALALALALTFIAYSGALGFPFVYDDHVQIVQNPYVHSWRFVARYFTEHVWGGTSPELLGNYYRPFFLLWLRINHMTFGLAPWGWHLSSVLAHCGVTLLVYVLAARTLGERWVSVLAALIFGLHPVHSEAVAWVSGATEPLMGGLLIGSFLCYLKKRDGGNRANSWLAASLLLFSFALLSKEAALVLPLLIFAYEWTGMADHEERASRPGTYAPLRNALWRTAPYMALVPLYLGARAAALKGLGHTVTPLPFRTVVLTWPSVMWFYLKLLIWPVGLSPYYNIPYVIHPDLVKVFLRGTGIIGFVILLAAWTSRAGQRAVLQPRTPKALAFASAWLIIPILPLLNLSVFPEGDIAHDRYLYLPSVGFAMLAAKALGSIRFGSAKPLGAPTLPMMVGVGLAAWFSLGTAFQSLIWADDLVLYTRALKSAPENNFVRTDLANVMAGRGLFGPAVTLYRQTLDRDPDFWPANYNLGWTYYRVGKFSEAETFFRRAIALKPNRPDPYLYLGLAEMENGRLEDAATAIRQAIRIRPEAQGYHFYLGLALKQQGDLHGALEAFENELEVNPERQAAKEQAAEVSARLRAPRSETPGFESPASTPERR